MAIRSSNERYSAGAIALHWTIALALAFQLALGFAMPKGAGGFEYYQLHKSVGISILLLSLARLAWRLKERPPPAVEGGWQGALAKTVHALLYAFMIGAPLTGWALVSTAPVEVPTILFRTVPWPHLPLPDAINPAVMEVHEALAWLGLALIALHIVGALRHQVVKRDGLLGRMGPAGSVLAAGALGLLVVALYFGTGMTVASRVVANGGYPVEGAEQDDTAAAERSDVAPAVLETPTEVEPEPEVAATEELPGEPAPPAAPPVWTIQPGGRLGFEASYDGQRLAGSFPDWSGDIAFDPEDPASARIAISVRLAGATLGDPAQDSMLRGSDGLGSGTATWRSTSVRRTGPGRYAAQGTLSLKGVSRPQAVTFTLAGEGLRRHVEGSAVLDRTSFGIDGGAADGARVTVSFAFDATARRPPRE